MEEVKLGVGEEIIKAEYRPSPLTIVLPNGRTIKEVARLNNLAYVIYNDEETILGGRIFRNFSHVYCYVPEKLPHEYINILKVGTNDLPRAESFIGDSVMRLWKDGKFGEGINGIKRLDSGSREKKQKIRRGKNNIQSEITLEREGIVKYQLLRYVPATPENRKKIEEVFGSV